MSNEHKDYEEFFELNKDYSFQVVFYECVRHFTVEEMYRYFKARMDSECKEEIVKRMDAARKITGNVLADD